ncbi:MAG: response regulator transcription factor [Candidatus Gastranaerophilales bacterium]|nr:response regulator transcription factor [Candidatus Gastranaerophilales bacterium]
MYTTDSINPIKILIVEDNSLFRKIIIDFLLEDSSFNVIGQAKDGQTAVRLTKELKPDLIIMDLGLPVMSGIEATIKIKESNPSVKIIAITSHVNQYEAVESLAAGATAYVNKDINILHMKMIIETINKGAIWISPLIGQKILLEGIKCYQK